MSIGMIVVCNKKDPCLGKEIIHRVYNSSSKINVNERMLAVERSGCDLLCGNSPFVKFYFKNVS